MITAKILMYLMDFVWHAIEDSSKKMVNVQDRLSQMGASSTHRVPNA